MFGQPISPSEITPPEIPMIPQFPDEPSPRPPAKRKRKPGPKPGSKPANAKPKQPANATPAATDLLTLACRFVDAAGGLANARNLLRQIGDIRK